MKKVRAFLNSDFEICGSWDEVGQNVSPSDCDVIVCLLSQIYYGIDLFRGEFDAAVTGSNESQSKKTYLPLIYVITFDKWAEKWLHKNHPNIPHKTKELYWFTKAADGSPLPVNLHSWQEFTLDMTRRVKVVKHSEAMYRER